MLRDLDRRPCETDEETDADALRGVLDDVVIPRHEVRLTMLTERSSLEESRMSAVGQDRLPPSLVVVDPHRTRIAGSWGVRPGIPDAPGRPPHELGIGRLV